MDHYTVYNAEFCVAFIHPYIHISRNEDEILKKLFCGTPYNAPILLGNNIEKKILPKVRQARSTIIIGWHLIV